MLLRFATGDASFHVDGFKTHVCNSAWVFLRHTLGLKMFDPPNFQSSLLRFELCQNH